MQLSQLLELQLEFAAKVTIGSRIRFPDPCITCKGDTSVGATSKGRRRRGTVTLVNKVSLPRSFDCEAREIFDAQVDEQIDRKVRLSEGGNSQCVQKVAHGRKSWGC